MKDRCLEGWRFKCLAIERGMCFAVPMLKPCAIKS